MSLKDVSGSCQKSQVNNVNAEEQETSLSDIRYNASSKILNLSEIQSTSCISNELFKKNKDSYTIESREHLISPFFVDGLFALSNAVLPGEFFEKSDFGEFRQCQIYLSKYRFVIVNEILIYSTPIINLESVESKEVTGLQIWCKDGRTIRVTAESREIALFWFKKLTQCACAQRNYSDLFATQFHLSVIRNTKLPTWIRKEAFSIVSPTYSYESIERELYRFGLEEKFRISCVNDDFRLCETYPQYLIVPSNLTDDELMNLRFCRSASRIPAVVWGNKSTGSVLLRSSQPIQGLFGTNQSDLDLMNKIRSALKEQNKFCFFDLRSYAAAWGNCAKGGGFENAEAYDGVIEFLGLANIHNVRSYFHQLRTLLNTPCDPNSFYQNLQGTAWLQSIWHLFQATSRCIKALCFENHSVLVHCTDGWDRTSQIVSLCMLIADSFYRTFEGFEILIQRQWIEFGHKFADRTSTLNGSPDERSPIFLQFLDCVYQLWCLNSHLFEFNRRYLSKLVQHTYSGLFSSFIFNNLKEASLSGYVRIDEPRNTTSSRLAHLFAENKSMIPKSFSIFDYLGKHNAEFLNPAYDTTSTKMLNFPKSMYDIELWRDAYCCIRPLNSINNPDDRFDSAELSIKSNLITVNDGESSTQLSQPHDKVISRSQSANSLKSLEQHGSNIYNTTTNLNINSITIGNTSQSNLQIFTQEEIQEYLDVDGLSKISNIFEERVVALYQELLSLKPKKNGLESNSSNILSNQYRIATNYKDSQKLNITSSSLNTNTVGDYNSYQSCNVMNIPSTYNGLNVNFNSNATHYLYQQNTSRRVRNESLDSSNYEMLLEELDGLTLSGLVTKRKKDSVGSSGSGSNLDSSICSTNQSFSNKNRLLQKSIVDELNEHDLPSSSTEDLVIGTNNYNSSFKSRSSGSEKLNDSFLTGGSAVRYSVSPAQIPTFISNVEDISSVPSSFSSAITEIHFQNGNELDNVDDDLRKDQLVVG